MATFAHLLSCVGKAVIKNGLQLIVSPIPVVGPLLSALVSIAADTLEEYRRERRDADLRIELEQIARATASDVRVAATDVVQQIAADQPPELQQRLNDYLNQLPVTVRQSLRGPADPTGTTVPATRRLSEPEDLVSFLPSRLPRFNPGDTPEGIGDWELVELLGAGGFGEVWKAKHIIMPNKPPRALKFCTSATAQELAHEAKVLDLVQQHGQHSGIVPLHDTHLRAATPCLVYEYIPGGDLTALLRELTETIGLSQKGASQLVRQVAKTVGDFHRLPEKIVHRDLKPANILAQRKGDGKVKLRVADFGIGGIAAKHALDKEAQAPTIHSASLPTAIRGAHTPLYASPQQIKGDPPDVRDDVHALGVIWYQLLMRDMTARPPKGKGWRRNLEQKGISTALLDLLENCLDDDPNERPADAAILAEELQRLLDPVPPPPPPPPPPPTMHQVHVLLELDRFQEALELLEQMPLDQRPRPLLIELRERWRSRSHEEASKLGEQHNYAAAVDLLESLPDSLRDQALLDLYRRHRDRVAELEKVIDTAIEPYIPR